MAIDHLNICRQTRRAVLERPGRILIMPQRLPVVVRLEGTNAKEAGELLDNSDIDFIVAKTLKDAAEKVVGTLE